jgi:hypothetical protein
MRFIRSLVIIPAVVATCGLALGCSYHKTVEETRPAPATVVTPPPATVVEPAPVVTVPPTTSSTTTTTTDTVPGVVERQKTTTYSVAP